MMRELSLVKAQLGYQKRELSRKSKMFKVDIEIKQTDLGYPTQDFSDTLILRVDN